MIEAITLAYARFSSSQKCQHNNVESTVLFWYVLDVIWTVHWINYQIVLIILISAFDDVICNP